MCSYKNARFHDEIRKWNTAQLIEALETNGLGDCCYAIQNREIDGETFLALTEGQLAFWKNTLTNVQLKRLWSYIQLAKERPQDFITNIPRSNLTETINTRKVEKIKSPIANSLNKLLEQQTAPEISQQSEASESNYPKPISPLNSNNDLLQRVPPRPGVLPPKPNFTRRPVPSPSLHSPIVVPSPSPAYPKPPDVPQYHEEEDLYEQEPMVEAQNDIQPSNFTRRPSPVINKPPDSISRPHFVIPSPFPVTSYPKPPVVQHHGDFYEQEPMVKPQNDVQSPLPPVNSSSLFGIMSSNASRKKIPLPVNYGRPLPSPPKDETPFPLPPNTVPIVRNTKFPQPLEVLPRPPVSFLPPPDIPDFHDHDDEEQEDYDIVDEVQKPMYRLQPWFRDIERKEAARELKGRPNGTFIVRPSRQREYECTFSVIHENKIYNLPVMKDNGKVVLGKNYFNTVSEIVDKYFTNPLVLNGPNNEDVFVTLRRF